MKDWYLGHSKHGFSVTCQESRWRGKALEWVLDRDPCWWGEYKNIPFCLINPWGWTWKIGPEDKSLGALWSKTGQALHQLAYRLEKARIVIKVVISDEEAKRIDPQFFADMKALDEED